MLDVIIKGGIVIDGSGSIGNIRDIGTKGDTISEVGNLGRCEAVEIVDATGLYVCPGFVDMHSHSDFNIFVEPPGKSKIQQGVTTEVCGNCGVSATPLLGEARNQRQKSLSTLDIPITWSSLREFFDILEGKKMLCNIVPLVGHGNLRGGVVGYDDRPPSSKEMEHMTSLLKDEMESGAWGLSSGLVYPPGIYASKGELVRLSKVVAQYSGIYTSHIRSEENGVIEAVEELLHVGEESGVSVQIAHLKTMGRENWQKLPLIFEKIEEALHRGVNVSADRYPYTAASTELDSLLPPWSCEGGVDKILRRLRNRNARERIFSYIVAGKSEKYLCDKIVISRVASSRNKLLEGKTLSQAAAIKKQSIKELFFDLLIEEEMKVGAIFFCMSEKNLLRILRKDYVMIGSDSAVWDIDGPLGEGKPHPRGFGTFPKVLRKYVFEKKILTLEEAVKKITAQPASKLGLRQRGLIQKGYKADLVIFKKEELKDNATYKNPHQFPSGIFRVMVNGQWALKQGYLTGAYPGKMLLKNN
jgi:N-acyl-D-amino-acid deacylase